MALDFVTYNIQFGRGVDGVQDFDRIAASLAGADVIALQEVERNWPRGGQAFDQPRELAARLPDHHWAYGPFFDVAGEGGRRRQHGVMVLAKAEILSSRIFYFPRWHYPDHFNMQMGMLEAVLDLASGPLRVYALHLGHLEAGERLEQLQVLKQVVEAAPRGGGAWSGPGELFDDDWSAGRPAPAMPETAVLLGDFNSDPGSAEYDFVIAALTTPAFVDAWVAAGHARQAGETFPPNPGRGLRGYGRIDHCFVSRDLADRVLAAEIDSAAEGSDHLPVRVQLAL